MGLMVAIWAAFAVFGMLVGSNKGRAGDGLLLGLLLGPIGVAIAVVMSPKELPADESASG